MTIAEFLAKVLKQVGCEKVFGIPSYLSLKMLEALDNEGFDFILNSHEQNAVHMAEGYYYATKKLPVVSIAIGPGVTNAVTGIANAYVESIPMIILIARASSPWLGRNEYHADSGYGRSIDERNLLKSVTKKIFYIDSEKNAEHLIYDAIRTALSDRPGPVVISIPPELQTKELNISKILSPKNYISKSDKVLTDETQDKFKKLFLDSKKPLFLLGKGIENVSKDLQRSVLENNCPYVTNANAKGKVPILENYLGSVWFTNPEKVRKFIDESDLLIFLGDSLTAFSANVYIKDYVQGKKVIQVNEYNEEVGRVCAFDIGANCDLKNIFSFLAGVEKKPWKLERQESREEEQKVKRKEYGTLNIIRKLVDLVPNNSVFFADVGNGGYAAITDLELKENQDFYTTTRFGSCGWSVPTNLGYAYGVKSRPCFSIVGDLSFNMNLQELMNVKKLNLKSNFIIFNNSILQNIAQDQLDEIGREIQTDMPKVDYARIAKAYGLNFVKIKTIEELDRFFGRINFDFTQNLVEIVLEKDDYPV
jgi:acetolactate synthase-1/2/3 large subunit